MNVYTAVSYLKSNLTELGCQLDDINQTNNNANLANTAGVVTYLLTSDSKNQTVRTIGGISSIVAILYGSSERRKSNQIKKMFKQNILDLVEYISNFNCQIFHSESDLGIKREFLSCILSISQYLDILVSDDILIVRKKGHLGKKNIEILMNLTRVNVFKAKNNLEMVIYQLDKSVHFFDGAAVFESAIPQLSLSEIIMEGMIIRLIVLGLMLTGAIVISVDNMTSSIFMISGILFWVTNHFFPVFSNTRHLKKLVNGFLKSLELTLGRTSLNY